MNGEWLGENWSLIPPSITAPSGPSHLDAAAPGVFDSSASCTPRRLKSNSQLSQGAQLDGEIGAFILDDGLQHLRLHRDWHVVTVNCLSPWGNGRLLPRGILRQPLESAIPDADVLVLYHAEQAGPERIAAVQAALRPLCKPCVRWVRAGFRITGLRHVTPTFPASPTWVGSRLDAANPLAGDQLAGAAVYCVAALGCPEAFFQSVSDLGPALSLGHETFPDHHLFTRAELAAVAARAAAAACASAAPGMPLLLLTSEKDAFRCRDQLAALTRPLQPASLARIDPRPSVYEAVEGGDGIPVVPGMALVDRVVTLEGKGLGGEGNGPVGEGKKPSASTTRVDGMVDAVLALEGEAYLLDPSDHGTCISLTLRK